jgi:hypothetical protein
MDQIDPFKLVRNGATLESYRQYQRSVRAAAQPWLTIALVAVLLQISLFSYELFCHDFRVLSLLFSLTTLVFGLSFAMAGIRIWQFRRSHPFKLLEAPSAFRWGRAAP